MLTVIIAIILSIIITINNLIRNPILSKKHKVNGALRLLIFSGSTIVIVLIGGVCGTIIAYGIGAFSDGEYFKVKSNKMVMILSDGDEYHYIKKIKVDGKDTITIFKFCFLDNSGDINFSEYIINERSLNKKNIQLHFCDVDSCQLRRDFYQKARLKGIAKYFGFSGPGSVFCKVKIFIPLESKFKEIYI